MITTHTARGTIPRAPRHRSPALATHPARGTHPARAVAQAQAQQPRQWRWRARKRHRRLPGHPPPPPQLPSRPLQGLRPYVLWYSSPDQGSVHAWSGHGSCSARQGADHRRWSARQLAAHSVSGPSAPPYRSVPIPRPVSFSAVRVRWTRCAMRRSGRAVLNGPGQTRDGPVERGGGVPAPPSSDGGLGRRRAGGGGGSAGAGALPRGRGGRRTRRREPAEAARAAGTDSAGRLNRRFGRARDSRPESGPVRARPVCA